MKISIIIVSYNVKHYLRQCLLSVWRALEGIDGEVFVIDNASRDGSVQFLSNAFPQTDYPHLHIIAGARNVGFGRANNFALKQATGEYILFLNPDTIVGEQCFRNVLAFADSHPGLGALGVKMLNDSGAFALESRRGIPTPWTAFCKMSGLGHLFPRSKRLGRYYMRWLGEDESAEIEIVSGAFMLCSHKALQQVGGFDERFFMYGEDIDLSFRLLQAGFKNYYVPTPIIHYKGESTHKNSYRYVHVFYEAMLIFFRKHYRHISPLLALPIKSAILLRASMALGGMALRFLHRFLSPQGGDPLPVFRYEGTHREALQRLSEATAFAIADAENEQKTVMTIYDAADHSYEEIIAQLQTTNHRRHLGIFYPDDDILVTGGGIFNLIPTSYDPARS